MNEFFKKLEEEINNHENIIIMGHINPDLDCIGASLGLYEAIKKECYIFKTKDKLNNSMKKAFEQIKHLNINFIDKTNYQEKLKNTLLIIVDLHKKQLLELEEITNKINDIIVIDHHIIGQDKIKTKLEYINPTISSTTEIITEYLKYKNIKINPIIATIMLSGIEIDTNGYNMKTTTNTHLASAHLMNMGADNILKQKILKENKEEYIKRTKQIEKSYMIKDMMICTLDEDIYNPSYLATLSEDLLRFDKVEASFTIGKLTKNKIGISARSLGNIDVEKYMSALGGGGHLTDAACQFESTNLKEIEQKLLQEIKDVKK